MEAALILFVDKCIDYSELWNNWSDPNPPLPSIVFTKAYFSSFKVQMSQIQLLLEQVWTENEVLLRDVFQNIKDELHADGTFIQLASPSMNHWH